MRNRRHSSTHQQPRHTAREVPPKSIELEQRIARVELAIERLTEKVERIEAVEQRLLACQAELQHLAAKVRL